MQLLYHMPMQYVRMEEEEVKGHRQTLCDVIPPEYSQKVQSLLGPFFSSSEVITLQDRLSSM